MNYCPACKQPTSEAYHKVIDWYLLLSAFSLGFALGLGLMFTLMSLTLCPPTPTSN